MLFVKVNQLQFSLDLIRGMEAPVRSGDEAALGKDEVLNEIKNFITAREKAIMRSLQQRLEQVKGLSEFASFHYVFGYGDV